MFQLLWMAAFEKPGPDNPILVVVGMVALVIFLIGCVVAGFLAFSGRWRSWYPIKVNTTTSPLVFPWMAGAMLLMLLAVGLHYLLDPIPLWLGGFLACCSVFQCVIGGIYIVPPRRMLPSWIRELQ
ncbi:hypothetical protein E1264_07545 [Actinomadura sp. KC216]|uniref:hypothetical protein n=1 Tax=Actinomadura sp. KC216 TaxID=2530370 RepID=UPI00104BB50E|nr:hypothetical protein [Actinomadura sp. KC216]TDB89632.1 hypothetical protein E1264_07545 [Actinomadura sp. KC216]